MGKKLREGKESAYTSRFLAEIKLDVPLGCEIEDCAFDGNDIATLRELYMRLGFKQFLDKLGEGAKEEAAEEEFCEIEENSFKGCEIAFLHTDGERTFAFANGKCYCGDAEKIADLTGCEKVICWSSKEILHLCVDFGVKLNHIEDLSLMAYVSSPADNGVSFGRFVLTFWGLMQPTLRFHCFPIFMINCRNG